MIVTRIVLESGRISERRKLNPEELDSALMYHVQRALSDLRSGKAIVVNPVPEGPQMTVALGVPVRAAALKEAFERISETYPELNCVDIETCFKERSKHEWRYNFTLVFGDTSIVYQLIRRDDVDWVRQFCLVLGSRSSQKGDNGKQAFKDRLALGDEARLAAIQEDWNVVREIADHRPAFIASAHLPNDVSQFGDCFAVAMLNMRMPHKPNLALRLGNKGRRS